MTRAACVSFETAVLYVKVQLAFSERALLLSHSRPDLLLCGHHSGGMSRPVKLALLFQWELDGGGGSDTSAAMDAGLAFQEEAVRRLDLDGNLAFLEPVILQTKLAASIVAHFERIQWAEITPRMLSEPPGTPLAAAVVGVDIMQMLFHSAVGPAEASGHGSPVVVKLLRQVLVLFRWRALGFRPWQWMIYCCRDVLLQARNLGVHLVYASHDGQAHEIV